MVKAEKNEEGQLVADNGVTYNRVPIGYQPVSQGEEYGVIKGVLEEKLYCVGSFDPKEWLTTESAGMATGVYCKEGIEIPALSELEPDLCYICQVGENVFSVYTLGDADNGALDKEKGKIEKIVEMLLDESVEAEMWPRYSDETYSLMFYSENWPTLYYCVDYMRESGGNYVYDYASKKCINVGDLLEEYFGDAETE